MTKGTFSSSDNINQISYKIYDNVENPIGIVQISHGMQDHIERYEDMALFLNDCGFIVCGNDHLGHGDSVGELGVHSFFAKKNGDKYVLNDLHTMTQIIKNIYPNLPLCLFGHSMGSFFARKYASVFKDEIDGLILCGTSGKVFGAKIMRLILKVMMFFKGKKSTSGLADKLMLSKYFKYIPQPNTKRDWITSSEQKLLKNIKDDKCNFEFKLKAYDDMLKTLNFVSSSRWAKKINKDLPIFLVSGAHDPVGQYGNGVCQVYSWLEKARVNSVRLNLYEQGRHEPFNEDLKIRNIFFEDVKDFLMTRVLKK